LNPMVAAAEAAAGGGGLVIGSWNLLASLPFHGVPDCLRQKLSNLARVAAARRMSLVVLQECPGRQLHASDLITPYLARGLEGGEGSYFANWKYKDAHTGGEACGFLYDPEVLELVRGPLAACDLTQKVKDLGPQPLEEEEEEEEMMQQPDGGKKKVGKKVKHKKSKCKAAGIGGGGGVDPAPPKIALAFERPPVMAVFQAAKKPNPLFRGRLAVCSVHLKAATEPHWELRPQSELRLMGEPKFQVTEISPCWISPCHRS
jgi:hypothetical protein